MDLEEANGDDGKQQFEESNAALVDDDFFYDNLEQTKIKKSPSSVKKKSKSDSMKKLKSSVNLASNSNSSNMASSPLRKSFNRKNTLPPKGSPNRSPKKSPVVMKQKSSLSP